MSGKNFAGTIIIISRWIPSDCPVHVRATLPQILFLNLGFRDRDKDKKQVCTKSMMTSVRVQYCLTSANKVFFNIFILPTAKRVVPHIFPSICASAPDAQVHPATEYEYEYIRFEILYRIRIRIYSV